jgi:hypothetical protein
MKKYLFSFCFILLVFACKNKKASLTDDEQVTVSDFIAFYPEVSLPYFISDTMLIKKPNDSMAIGYKTFTKFIPDTIFRKEFGKTTQPKLYALASTAEKGKEKYVFTQAVAGNKRVAYLACFSKDDKFLKAMPLLRIGFDHFTSAYGLLDSKFQITTYRETKKANGDVLYKRNIYFYDRNSDNFTLIVTEPNEDIIQDIINPIDTLAAKNKFSGDYVLNTRNYVSVRDGRDPSEMIFFVHFEKNNGECTGELKGTARFISPGVAQYAKSDNPCVVEFAFTGSKVTMKEKGGCGSYRDIKCFFEGSYWKKKKAAKQKTAAGKK